MAFINWNLVTPTLPVYYTYVLQPPLATQLSNQQLASIRINNIEPVVGNNETKTITIRKQESTLTKIKEEVKEEPDSDTDVTEEKHFGEIIKVEENEVENGKKGKNFSCDYCSYTTDWKGNLSKHVVSRHTALDEIKWLQCDHCSYKGKTKDYLKGHLLHVHNIPAKTFPCPHCTFTARFKVNLRQHVLSKHTESNDIQWHTCDHCPYRAKFKVNLKMHVLSKHTEPGNIQWFHCDQCSYKAKRRRYLRLHQFNMHLKSDDGEELKCEFCRYQYRNKAALQVHIASVHGKGKVKMKPKTKEIPVFIENKLCWRRIMVDSDSDSCSFNCSQCQFEAIDKELLKKHVLKEHVLTEFKEENQDIIKRAYKTKDVIVLVDDVPCLKKIVEHPLSQND